MCKGNNKQAYCTNDKMKVQHVDDTPYGRNLALLSLSADFCCTKMLTSNPM